MPLDIPEKYQFMLKDYNPKTAEEAYKFLLRNDYVNEISSISYYIYINRAIAYSPKTTSERYPEFSEYNLNLLPLERKLNKIVLRLRKDIKFYNKRPTKRAQYKAGIEQKISDIIGITDKI